MKPTITWQLLAKYAAQETNEEENEFIQNWIRGNKANKSLLDSAIRIYSYPVQGTDNFDTKAAKARLLKNLFQKKTIQETSPTSIYSAWWRMAAVLVVALGVTLALYFVNKEGMQEVWVEKVAQKGQRKHFNLPDGSEVHLNANSTLAYVEGFKGENRKLKLTGEAFFIVKPNAQKPFIVETYPLTTTVLGTSFNIRSYQADSASTVSVLSGKVQVALATEDQKGEIILSPNEQAKWSVKKNGLVQETVNTEQIAAWRKGILKFENQSLAQVAEELEKWFDVKIRFENTSIGNCLLTAEFKNESLHNILESICLTADLKYGIKEKNILISGTGCARNP